jgi:soluble lytic murein transglycosylase-like protein
MKAKTIGIWAGVYLMTVVAARLGFNPVTLFAGSVNSRVTSSIEHILEHESAFNATALKGSEYSHLLSKAGNKYHLNKNLLAALTYAESGFKKNAKSGKGAVGLTQIVKKTAKDLGIKTAPVDERLIPEKSIMGGAEYLRLRLDKWDNNTVLALAAYNAGDAHVERAINRFGRDYVVHNLMGLPSETINYVVKVLALKHVYDTKVN